MNVTIFLRNDEKSYIEEISYLVKKMNLKYIVYMDSDFDEEVLNKYYDEVNILTYKEYRELLKEDKLSNIDFIFSYYFQVKIEEDIINSASRGCVNFHPAPLPIYRGVANYIKCIDYNLDKWGCTAHLMDNIIDNGRIIKKLEFKVNSKKETYLSLEYKTKKYMEKLFKYIIDIIYMGDFDKIINTDSKDLKNKYEYIYRKDLDNIKYIGSLKNINLDVDSRIRSLWRPPNHGAFIKIDDVKYTLINEQILKEIWELYLYKLNN